MKAVAIQAFGSPEGLAVIDLPVSSPAPGQVLIATEAIGVGGVDAMILSGAYAAYGFREGHVLGGEIAGAVTDIGDGVDASWAGQRVWAFTGLGGGYAEQAIAPASTLVPLPAGMPASDAVTLGSSGAVAHFGLRHARFAPGESVLVRGAAGGIGIMTVQLAARGGAGAVAVTTSSDERADRLRGLGATHALDRSGQGGQDAPAGYDVIIDIVAGPAMPSFFARLNPNGRMVAVGAVAGNPPADFGMELFAAFQKSLSFATFSGNTVTETDRRAVTAELLAAAVRGELRSVVHEVLPLEQAALAHRKMAAGEVFGRIVLTPLPAFVSAGRPSYRSSAALAPASEKISLVTPAATSSNSRFMLAHRGPADPAGRVALVGGSPAPVRDRVFDFSERGRGACPYVTTGADW